MIAAEERRHVADAAASLATGGARVETHASDLATEAGVDGLFGALRGRPVDVLCVNAGVGLGGAFADTDLQAELRMIDLNVRGAVQITKLVLRGMIARDQGKILFTSSIAATLPDPFAAVDGSTKVVLRSLGEALRNELKDTGIGVTVLMPGVTDTNFVHRAEMDDTRAGASESKDDPDAVAKAAYAALMADKHRVVPTLKNKAIAAVPDAMPGPLAARIHRGLSEPGSGGKGWVAPERDQGNSARSGRVGPGIGGGRRSMEHRDIIVIGGSSGATRPLKAILGALPPSLPAAVFVVLHVPARSIGILTTVAQAATHLPVRAATDGLAIEPGHVYLGVPDRHLILAEGEIRLGRGPRENLARPAIDALFRSAAATFGPRVVGVLLSGLLNDGAAGLSAIKRCGGLALVQDPEDAIADEMPLSGLRAVTADLVAPGPRIGDVLADLAGGPAGPRMPIPPELRLEVDIAAGERMDSAVLRRIADPVAITCPQCGGVMSGIRAPGPLRFRCQVGHAYTADALAKEQETAVDEALRVALRIIEERAELVSRMAADGRASGRRAVAEMYEERSIEYRQYADTIRRAVLETMIRAEPQGEEGGQGGLEDEEGDEGPNGGGNGRERRGGSSDPRVG